MNMDSASPSVSVVMACHNAADTIAESIESVLSQTEKSLELLIIDDGSTDNTLSVVNQFNDPRITLIRKPHQGQTRCLNDGIEAALRVSLLRALMLMIWHLPSAWSDSWTTSPAIPKSACWDPSPRS